MRWRQLLSNLDLGMTQVDSVRGEIGARMNIIDTTQADNDDVTPGQQGRASQLARAGLRRSAVAAVVPDHHS